MPTNKPVKLPRNQKPVQTAREIAQKEVEEAKARKVESSLKAEKIVPAKSPDRKLFFRQMPSLEKITREAEAKCKGYFSTSRSGSKNFIQMKLEAEAEGKKQ